MNAKSLINKTLMIKEKSSTCAYIPFLCHSMDPPDITQQFSKREACKIGRRNLRSEVANRPRATLQQTTTKVGKITAAKSSLATVRFDN